ncbi:hypothetical protein SLS63_008837 [Diaporthe eres]|uniref:Uncharacterized protein n=1 Tax=Diaporthe eres TaxID=83184 RepID=A0ABR1P176_DIAER
MDIRSRLRAEWGRLLREKWPRTMDESLSWTPEEGAEAAAVRGLQEEVYTELMRAGGQWAQAVSGGVTFENIMESLPMWRHFWSRPEFTLWVGLEVEQMDDWALLERVLKSDGTEASATMLARQSLIPCRPEDMTLEQRVSRPSMARGFDDEQQERTLCHVQRWSRGTLECIRVEYDQGAGGELTACGFEDLVRLSISPEVLEVQGGKAKWVDGTELSYRLIAVVKLGSPAHIRTRGAKYMLYYVLAKPWDPREVPTALERGHESAVDLRQQQSRPRRRTLSDEDDSQRAEPQAAPPRDPSPSTLFPPQRRAKKMEEDLADKPVLEKKCARLEEQVGALETEKADLGQDLQGKTALLQANVAAKESSQKLADQCKTDLDQKTGELDRTRTLLGKTQELLDLATEKEQDLRDKYLTEHDLCEETLNQLKQVQDKCAGKEAEVEKLEAVVASRDQEVTALNDSIRSKDEEIGLKDEQIRDQGTELFDLTHTLGVMKEELEEEKKSLARSKADGEETRRGKESAELDLGLALSLSIRAGDVRVQDWIPFLRSLRDGVPARVSPEHTPAPVWAVLPSWTDSSSDEEVGSGSFELSAVPSTPDALLFELFGHAMAEGDIRCNACLRALATLSAQVGRHGPTKVGSFVIVLGGLVARVQALEAITGYHRMLLLGMKYLAALLRFLVSETDAAGLASVEDSLDGLMGRADTSLGVIRHVSDALCGSGDIQACEPQCFRRLDSSEGRSLLFFAEPRQPDGLFLLADPEQRTIRAVSTSRYTITIAVSDGNLVNSGVIKAPAGQPDISLVHTDDDYDWAVEHFY